MLLNHKVSDFAIIGTFKMLGTLVSRASIAAPRKLLLRVAKTFRAL